jgi:hydrogenase-4 component B
MTAMLLGSCAALLLLAVAAGRPFPRFWLVLNSLGALAGLAAAVAVLVTGQGWVWNDGPPLGGENVILNLDAVSALFLVLVCIVGGLGAIYSHEYWSEHHFPRSAARGRAWWSVLVLSMVLVLTCGNGLHFLFAWEAFALSAYFLITLDNERKAVRKAGWLYLAASHAGTMGLFAFFSAMAAKTGSWVLGPMHSTPELAPLFWLMLFGFGVKAGMFPLHIWLPSAHANAPSHVSAIMSAVAIKMGVYGIIRFSGWLPLPANAGWVVMGIGCASALVGIVFAITQNDMKRLLAYCSVENVGIILVGLGLSLLATAGNHPAWGQAALAGTLLHILNHGLFKSLLFFGAGSVLHATGTKDMTRLGGLWRTMPWTAALFALGAAAVAGLPPLNGFISEWAIYQGLLRAVAVKGETFAVLPAVVVLAGTGALALAAFTKAVSVVFLGAPRGRDALNVTECGWTMRIPMLLPALVMISIGLMPGLFLHPIQNVIAVWAPQWAASDSLLPIRALGGAHTVLACVLVAAALAITHKIRANGTRRGLTWDCGYAAPTAHMQYSSGSFAGIVEGWFAWALRPERRLRRVHGYFPQTALALERVPETVLEKGIGPAAHVVMVLANVARNMQHGRLQLYILYVFLGVTALGLLVFQGGM